MQDPGFQFDNSYARLPEGLFTRQKPAAVEAPDIALINHALAGDLGLDLGLMPEDEQAALFSGNALPEGAEPIAQAYAGHQFGHFTILGDGRAIVMGEHITPDNRRFDIQYKGSGRTPYSRRGDGRAALAPMLREYLVSEAMHGLNIPTTRSMAVVKTGETVMRERPEPGAVLTRVAGSHIRVGTFEYAASLQDPELVKALLDHTISRHFPDLAQSQDKAIGLIRAVMDKQADLVVEWMRVGFIHGVMNTDNMALSGETIDYGPCAFMDAYDPATVFSSIDHMGRYAYENQPVIAQWNITRLAETLLPFIHGDIDSAIKRAQDAIQGFPGIYSRKWVAMMRGKLGLQGSMEGDENLIDDLLAWMHNARADYTNTFRDLATAEAVRAPIFEDPEFRDWHTRWYKRLQQNEGSVDESLQQMRSNNPAVIPRNHNVEQALQAANVGDMQPLHDLMAALKSPYEDSDIHSPFKAPPAPEERVLQTFCGT